MHSQDQRLTACGKPRRSQKLVSFTKSDSTKFCKIGVLERLVRTKYLQVTPRCNCNLRRKQPRLVQLLDRGPWIGVDFKPHYSWRVYWCVVIRCRAKCLCLLQWVTTAWKAIIVRSACQTCKSRLTTCLEPELPTSTYCVPSQNIYLRTYIFHHKHDKS